jgi:starch-binding outer membrane protein, SusD/RagB family
MKKSFFISICTITAISIFFACKEENLDLSPLQISEDQYFKNETEMEAAVKGTYAKLTDLFWFNANSFNHGFTLLPGDDITTLGNAPFEAFFNLNANTGEVEYMYKKYYELISRANIVLEKIDAADASVYKNAELKKTHKGEALFLRGFAFFKLANYFGTSPLINKRIKSIDATTPNGSKDTELLDQAIKDFQEAASLAPASWSNDNKGRITANAANGMLGKALVYRGSIKKNSADFTAALTALNKVTGKLVPKYGDNFSAKAENNEESLFEFQATQFGVDNVWLPNDFGGGVGSTSAYWGFYENHWSLFGAPRYNATRKLVNTFAKGDPRLNVLVDSGTVNIKKYLAEDVKTNTGVASANNPRLLRYADIILLKAEALLESGGSTTEAIKLVNEVRTRARNMKAGGTEPANFSETEADKAKIWNWIANERFMELAGEDGIRYLDLRRWHLAGKINLATWDFGSERPNSDVVWDPKKNILYPIPLDELDYNKNMQQNAGY